MDVILIFLFVTGLFFGSFYNVVGLRMPNNESIVYPGSHCVNCRHRLAWYELIPVFSYIFLKGKCKVCKKKVSLIYPIMELLTGILFAASYLIFGYSINTIISIVLVSLAIITLVSDIKFMVILDEILIVSGILIVILLYFSGGFTFVLKSLLRGLIIFAIMLFVKLIGDKAFKQESLGWGDVKLSFIAGLVLGIKLGVVYIFLSAVTALPCAIIQTIKKNTNIIPFGPFLVSSIVLLYWLSDVVLNLLNTFLGGY